MAINIKNVSVKAPTVGANYSKNISLPKQDNNNAASLQKSIQTSESQIDKLPEQVQNDIKAKADNRNFIQKALGIQPGNVFSYILSPLNLLQIPQEAVENTIFNIAKGNGVASVLESPFKALTGDQRVSGVQTLDSVLNTDIENSSGFAQGNIGGGILKLGAELGPDVLLDPLVWASIPITGGGSLLGKITGEVADKAALAVGEDTVKAVSEGANLTNIGIKSTKTLTQAKELEKSGFDSEEALKIASSKKPLKAISESKTSTPEIEELKSKIKAFSDKSNKEVKDIIGKKTGIGQYNNVKKDIEKYLEEKGISPKDAVEGAFDDVEKFGKNLDTLKVRTGNVGRVAFRKAANTIKKYAGPQIQKQLSRIENASKGTKLARFGELMTSVRDAVESGKNTVGRVFKNDLNTSSFTKRGQLQIEREYAHFQQQNKLAISTFEKNDIRPLEEKILKGNPKGDAKIISDHIVSEYGVDVTDPASIQEGMQRYLFQVKANNGINEVNSDRVLDFFEETGKPGKYSYFYKSGESAQATSDSRAVKKATGFIARTGTPQYEELMKLIKPLQEMFPDQEFNPIHVLNSSGNNILEDTSQQVTKYSINPELKDSPYAGYGIQMSAEHYRQLTQIVKQSQNIKTKMLQLLKRADDPIDVPKIYSQFEAYLPKNSNFPLADEQLTRMVQGADSVNKLTPAALSSTKNELKSLETVNRDLNEAYNKIQTRFKEYSKDGEVSGLPFNIDKDKRLANKKDLMDILPQGNSVYAKIRSSKNPIYSLKEQLESTKDIFSNEETFNLLSKGSKDTLTDIKIANSTSEEIEKITSEKLFSPRDTSIPKTEVGDKAAQMYSNMEFQGREYYNGTAATRKEFSNTSGHISAVLNQTKDEKRVKNIVNGLNNSQAKSGLKGSPSLNGRNVLTPLDTPSMFNKLTGTSRKITKDEQIAQTVVFEENYMSSISRNLNMNLRELHASKLLTNAKESGLIKPLSDVEVNKVGSEGVILNGEHKGYHVVTVESAEKRLFNTADAEYLDKDALKSMKEDFEDVTNSAKYVLKENSTYLNKLSKIQHDEFLKNKQISNADFKKLKDGDKKLYRKETVSKSTTQYMAVQPFIYNHLFASQKVMNTAMTSLVKTVDKVLTAWKKTALFSIGYHVRNFISNNINALMATGGNPVAIAKYVKNYTKSMVEYQKYYGKGEKSILYRVMTELESPKNLVLGDKEIEENLKKVLSPEEYKIHEQFTHASKNAIINNGRLNAALPHALEKFRNNQYLIRKLGDDNKLKGLVSHIFRSNFKLTQANDDISRLAMYRTAAEHPQIGTSLGISDPISVSHAVFFDYNEMTYAEKNIIKKFIPFYTWFRKNMGFTFHNVVSNPQRFSVAYNFFKSYRSSFGLNPITSSDVSTGNLYLPLPIPAINGNIYELRPNIPLLELGALTSPLIFARVSPLFAVPYEMLTGRNLATGFASNPLQTFINALPGPLGTVGRSLSNNIKLSQQIEPWLTGGLSEIRRNRSTINTFLLKAGIDDPNKLSTQKVQDILYRLRGLRNPERIKDLLSFFGVTSETPNYNTVKNLQSINARLRSALSGARKSGEIPYRTTGRVPHIKIPKLTGNEKIKVKR